MEQFVRTEQIEVSSIGKGTLFSPHQPEALIIFAHGGGSSRLSPRNIHVAEGLAQNGFACLLFDLLNEKEAADRKNIFDISLMGARVKQAIDWTALRQDLANLPIGLFGASTGAAAAFVGAARSDRVFAIVSRGGRPDLAMETLPDISAPTLLIVGGQDVEAVDLNREALRCLTCARRLEMIPGATHLFEEPGALDTVAASAAAWFRKHLPVPAASP